MATATINVSSQSVLDGVSTFDGALDSVVQANLKVATSYTSGQLIAVETTLSGGLSIDLDTLTNVHNESVNLATLFLLLVLNDDDTNDVTLSGQAMLLLLGNATHEAVVTSQSGSTPGRFLAENPGGWTVTDASDVLTFTEAAGTPTIRYYIVGAE